MKFSYILLALCLLILVFPVSAVGTAQLGWYNDTEGGGCVTAVDTNDDGTLVIAGYWNGNITAYNIVVNVSNSSASATVAWRNSTYPGPFTSNNTIKKIVADENGNIAWISERKAGYISSSGAVGSQISSMQNFSDVALRSDAGAYAVTQLRSGTTPSKVTIYTTGGTIYAQNTSFGTNVNWTRVGYDPNNYWIVTANESSNRLYYWNITPWLGWDEFNPSHTASKNTSQQFLDSFPYRLTFNITPNTGVKGIFFQNTSSTGGIVKVNESYYQYNTAYVGPYFYWTKTGCLTNVQSEILNMSIINGSGVNTNYSIMFAPGYYNYTFYFGNWSYAYNYIEQDNHVTIVDGSYTVLVWGNPGNYSWHIPPGVTSIQYLVVGGGGYAGGGRGGGGGGGQVVGQTGYSVIPGDTINIAVGGLATNSSFANATTIIRAKNATNGQGEVGSGGNAGNGIYTGGAGGADPFGDWVCGGGGAGNGSNGGSYSGWGGGCSPGAAGAGTSSSITGTPVTYGYGGVGAWNSPGTAASGNTAGTVIIRYLGSPSLYFGEPPTTSTQGVAQVRQTAISLNQSSIHDYVGNIMDLDVPSTGALASISTETIFYQQYILPSGFDTYWCATYPLGGYVLYPGTVHDVEASNGGSASISARGNYANVYDSGAVLRASLLTGGVIQSADSAMTSGIFAAFGGDAGILYMFSKEGSSTWYTYYTGGIASPIKSVATGWNGECVVVGRGDGRFEYYITNISITPTPTPSYVDAQVRVFKDSTAYANQPVTVYSSTAYNPYVWSPAGTSYTDGGGVFTYTTTAGTYYKFVVNNAPGTTSGEGEAIWQSNTASTIVQIFIISASTPYEWNAYYNTASNNVTVVYSDTITPTSVIVSIKDLKTNLVVLTRTYVATPSFTLEYHDQLGNGTYQVSIIINRLGGSVRDQRTVMSPNTYGTILPNDQYITWAISTFVLMLIAGMFSYSNSKRGALAVVVVAVIMMIFKLLPWGLMTVAMLAAIFAVMSLFASRVQ